MVSQKRNKRKLDQYLDTPDAKNPKGLKKTKLSSQKDSNHLTKGNKVRLPNVTMETNVIKFSAKEIKVKESAQKTQTAKTLNLKCDI